MGILKPTFQYNRERHRIPQVYSRVHLFQQVSTLWCKQYARMFINAFIELMYVDCDDLER